MTGIVPDPTAAAEELETAAELARAGDDRAALRSAFVASRLLAATDADGRFEVALLPVCPDCDRPMPETGGGNVDWACMNCEFVLIGGNTNG